MSAETRGELLEELYDTWWNRIATLESDLPGYALISNSDVNELDRICEAIER